jgi:hypothetical protein
VEEYLTGGLAAWDDAVTLDWCRGWVDRARLALPSDDGVDFACALLRELVAVPAARFLRELVLGVFAFDGSSQYGALLRVVAEQGAPALRSLVIGDVEWDEQELSWLSCDLSVLSLPRVERLSIRSGELVLGALAFPRLRSLVVETTSLTPANVAEVLAADLRGLEELVLWVGTESRDAVMDVAVLEPLLRPWPKLRRFGLPNAEITDEICASLAFSALADQVEELDLSRGTMTGAGVEALARGGFPRLRTLDARRNALDADAVERLLARFPFALVDGQRPGSRYCDVSE